MKNTGRKTGTCPVMKGKDTKSFHKGGVSVGSVKALRKKNHFRWGKFLQQLSKR